MMSKYRQDSFEEDLDRFVKDYCWECFKEKEIDYNTEGLDEDISAVIKLTDFGRMKWEVPIVCSDKRIYIHTEDAGALQLTGINLYVYLWLEAKDRIK